MVKKLFNDEEEQFIMDNVRGKYAPELALLFNEKFNRNITWQQISRWKRNNKISSGLGHKPLFNKEEEQFIIDNAYGVSSEDLTNMFNKKFNKNMEVKQIRNYKEKNRIKNGRDTTFKCGKQVHSQSKPLGSEYVKYDRGLKQTYIKVGFPNVWELKNRYMYKKYHGEIPKNCKIIFLNGNRDDFSKENLECITMHEQTIMASSDYYFNNKELTKTGLLITKLKIKTWDKMRGE